MFNRLYIYLIVSLFFFQAEDGIRDLVRSRGLGDVYKRQAFNLMALTILNLIRNGQGNVKLNYMKLYSWNVNGCLLYTSDAADERSSVDLGGRRIIKKKK